ncbi:hypothetical protein ABMA79_08545 [Halobacteriovorax sp. HFRX-2_2]|uniref:hypothetical protein n=1 Tax=unclassified Halobacteriovorax TaxID=2639665 RepID=UPI00371B6556
MKKLFDKIALSCLLVSSAFASDLATDLSSEIKVLNAEYGNIKDYPIVIFDKSEVIPLLKGHSEEEQIKLLSVYMLQKFNIELERNEAINLIPYFGILNGSASALPFMKGGWSNEFKFCAVFPNGVVNDLPSEVRRVLGHSDEVDVYENFDFSQFEKIFSLEELHYYSLYHELSHCLDDIYLPENYQAPPSGHGVHQSESFAEVNALFLMAQKKGLKRIGINRALLRKTYSKYMGPYLASDKVSPFAGEVVKQGGGVYFLSPVLIAAQREIENYNKDVLKYDLNETLKLSATIVEHHSINSRSFQGFAKYFKDGKEETLKYYKGLADRDPDLFLASYYDLVYLTSILEN